MRLTSYVRFGGGRWKRAWSQAPRWLPSQRHGGFGGRPGETDWLKGQCRVPVRPYAGEATRVPNRLRGRHLLRTTPSSCMRGRRPDQRLPVLPGVRHVNGHVVVADQIGKTARTDTLRVLLLGIGSGFQQYLKRCRITSVVEDRVEQSGVAVAVADVHGAPAARRISAAGAAWDCAAKCRGVIPALSARPGSAPSARAALKPATSPCKAP